MELPAPKVLVVDSRSRATTSLIEYLKDRGYDVVWASDGETAYNILDDEIIDVMPPKRCARARMTFRRSL
jgi:DNA-binding response OmpR family regulator